MTTSEYPHSFSCLAIETATALSTVAASHEGRVHSVCLSGNRPGAGEVYAAIDEALAAVAAEPINLNCIAFGCGPGGFTGVRIAAAVTQGLAYGLQLPVFRFSSLGLLAMGAALQIKNDSGNKVFAAAIDARQDESYVGFYRIKDGIPQTIMPDALVKPAAFDLADVAKEHELAELVLSGPGWQVYPSLVTGAESVIVANDFDRLPQAINLLSLAEEGHRAGKLTDAFAAQPNYLRDKVTD